MVPQPNDNEGEPQCDILAKTPITTKRARMSESESKNASAQTSDRENPIVTPRQGPSQSDSKDISPEMRSLLLEEAGFDMAAKRSDAAWRKRQHYLGWDDFFFGVAVLSSRRSKNPNGAYGACIVDAENRVVGIGYDGLPRDCPDDCIPYQMGDGKTPFLHTQNPYICHAEVNAILNKCSADVAGCRMYVERFPCNECAKVIIQSRIQEVIYLKDEEPDKDMYKASRILFAMAGVKTTHYTTAVSSIDLQFVSALAPTTKDAAVEATTEEVVTTKGPAANSETQERFRDLMVREAEYDPVTTPSSHRTDYICWDDYFMAMAFLTAKRSKDPNTQVGAVIVHADTKRILAMGYNGFPRGCSDDCLPWARQGESELHKKYVYVCHAEVNAILNKGSAEVKGATLFVALFPCNECSKMIIQAGIQEVVYMNDQYHDTPTCRASRIMFQMAGVRLRKHIPSFQSLHLDLCGEQKGEQWLRADRNVQ